MGGSSSTSKNAPEPKAVDQTPRSVARKPASVKAHESLSIASIERQRDCLFPTWDNRVQTFFKFTEKLGRGGFGLVWKVERRSDGELMACKIMNKTKMKPSTLEAVVHEVKYMRRLDHPNILKFICGMETQRKLYLMTELLAGELDEAIGSLTEEDIQGIVLQVLSALEYAHGQGVIHSDLKPENIMFSDRETNKIKLIDFGLSKSRKRWQWVSKVGGTPAYIAPECLTHRYNEAIDLWALGIITFECFFGYVPFQKFPDDAIRTIQDSTRGFTNKVKSGRGNWFPSEKPISPEAMDFIVCLLKVNPSKRITAAEGRSHPWFARVEFKKQAATSMSFVFDSLLQKQNLNKVQQFLRQVLKVKGQQMHSFLTNELDRLFQKYDAEKNGWLTWEQFRQAMEDFAADQEHIGGEDVDALFVQIDTKNTGQIAYEDMVSWMAFQHLSKQDDRVWDAVMELDRNNTGRVSVEDLGDFLKNKQIRDKLSMDTIKAVQQTMKKGPLDYMEFIRLMEGAGPED